MILPYFLAIFLRLADIDISRHLRDYRFHFADFITDIVFFFRATDIRSTLALISAIAAADTPSAAAIFATPADTLSFFVITLFDT